MVHNGEIYNHQELETILKGMYLKVRQTQR
jgi:asparagine synthetase B (glutamine-hydrolysing)